MFHKFPDEITRVILPNLDYQDILRLRLVNQKLNQLITEFFNLIDVSVTITKTTNATSNTLQSHISDDCVKLSISIRGEVLTHDDIRTIIPSTINKIVVHDGIVCNQTMIRFLQQCRLTELMVPFDIKESVDTKNLITSHLYNVKSPIEILKIDSCQFTFSHLQHHYQLNLFKLEINIDSIDNQNCVDDIIQIIRTNHITEINLILGVAKREFGHFLLQSLNQYVQINCLTITIQEFTGDDDEIFHFYNLTKLIQIKPLIKLNFIINCNNRINPDIEARFMIILQLLKFVDDNLSITCYLNIIEQLDSTNFKLKLIKKLPIKFIIGINTNSVANQSFDTKDDNSALSMIYNKYSYLENA